MGSSYFLSREPQQPTNAFSQIGNRIRQERQLNRQNMLQTMQMAERARRNRYYEEQARAAEERRRLAIFGKQATSKARQEAQDLNAQIRNRLKSEDPATIRKELEEVRAGFRAKHSQAFQFDPTIAQDFDNTVDRYAADIDSKEEKRRQMNVDWEATESIRKLERAVQAGQVDPQEAFGQMQTLLDRVRQSSLDETRLRGLMKRADDFEYRTNQFIEKQRDRQAAAAEKAEQEQERLQTAYGKATGDVKKLLGKARDEGEDPEKLAIQAAYAQYAEQGLAPEGVPASQLAAIDPQFKATVDFYKKRFEAGGGFTAAMGDTVRSTELTERERVQAVVDMLEGKTELSQEMADALGVDPVQYKAPTNKYDAEARRQLVENLKNYLRQAAEESPVNPMTGEKQIDSPPMTIPQYEQQIAAETQRRGERIAQEQQHQRELDRYVRGRSNKGSLSDWGESMMETPALRQGLQLADVFAQPVRVAGHYVAGDGHRSAALSAPIEELDDFGLLAGEATERKLLEHGVDPRVAAAAAGGAEFLGGMLEDPTSAAFGVKLVTAPLKGVARQLPTRMRRQLAVKVGRAAQKLTPTKFANTAQAAAYIDSALAAAAAPSLGAMSLSGVGEVMDAIERDGEVGPDAIRAAIRAAGGGFGGIAATAGGVSAARRGIRAGRDAAAARRMKSTEPEAMRREIQTLHDPKLVDRGGGEEVKADIEYLEKQDMYDALFGETDLERNQREAPDRARRQIELEETFGRAPEGEPRPESERAGPEDWERMLQDREDAAYQPLFDEADQRERARVFQDPIDDALAREDFEALEKLEPEAMRLVEIAADVEKIWEPNEKLRTIMEYENRTVDPRVGGTVLEGYQTKLTDLEKKLKEATKKATSSVRDVTKKKWADTRDKLRAEIEQTRQQLRIEQTTEEGKLTEASRKERRRARAEGREAVLREGGAQQWAADLLRKQFGDKQAQRLMQAFQTGEYQRFRESRAGGALTQGKHVRRGRAGSRQAELQAQRLLEDEQAVEGMLRERAETAGEAQARGDADTWVEAQDAVQDLADLRESQSGRASLPQPGTPVAESRGFRIEDLITGGPDALAARAEKLATDRRISLHQANNILRNQIADARKRIDPILNKAKDGKELTDADRAVLNDVLGSDRTARAAVEMAQREGFDDFRDVDAPEDLSGKERTARSRKETKQAREELGLGKDEKLPEDRAVDPDAIRAELEQTKKELLAAKEGSTQEKEALQRVRDLEAELKTGNERAKIQAGLAKRIRSELDRDFGELFEGDPDTPSVARTELEYVNARAQALRDMLKREQPDPRRQGRRPGPERQAAAEARRTAIGEQLNATESRGAELRRWLDAQQKGEPRTVEGTPKKKRLPKGQQPKGEAPTGLKDTAADLRKSIQRMLDQRVRPGERGAMQQRIREAQRRLADAPDAKKAEIQAEIDRLMDEPVRGSDAVRQRAEIERKITELQRRLDGKRKGGLNVEGDFARARGATKAGGRPQPRSARPELDPTKPKPGEKKAQSLNDRLAEAVEKLGKATGLEKVTLTGQTAVLKGALRADLRTRIHNATQAGDKNLARKLRKQLREMGGDEGATAGMNRVVSQAQLDVIADLAVKIADGAIDAATALRRAEVWGIPRDGMEFLGRRLRAMGNPEQARQAESILSENKQLGAAKMRNARQEARRRGESLDPDMEVLEVLDPTAGRLEAGVGEGMEGTSSETFARQVNQNLRGFAEVNSKTGEISWLGSQREGSNRGLGDDWVRFEVDKQGNAKVMEAGGRAKVGLARAALERSDLGVKKSGEAGFIDAGDLKKGLGDLGVKVSEGIKTHIEKWKRLYTSMKDLDDLVRPAARKLAGITDVNGKPAGKRLLGMFEAYRDDHARQSGNWLSRFERVSRQVSDAVKKNGEDWLQKGSKQAEEVRGLLKEIYAEAKAAGVHVAPERGDYFPRIFDDRDFGTRVDSLAERIVKVDADGKSLAPIGLQKFAGRDAADPEVRLAAAEYINGGIDIQAWNRINGNLEMKRRDVRQDYIKDLDVIADYIDKASRRIAEVKHLGQGGEKVRPIIKGMSNEATAGSKGDADWATDLTRDVLGLQQPSALVRDIQTFISSAKLFYSMPMQLMGAARTITDYGVAPSLRAAKRLAEDMWGRKNKGYRYWDLEAMEAGALSQNVGGVENVEFRAQRGKDLSLFGKATSLLPGFDYASKRMWGTEWMDRITRVHGYRAAIDAFGVAARNGDEAFTKTFGHSLAEARDLVKRAEGGDAKARKALQEVGRKGSDRALYRTGVLDTPRKWRSPAGRLFFQFSNFMYQHTRWVFGEVENVAKAMKNESPAAAAKKAMPLIKFFALVSPVVGEVGWDLKSIMQGHGLLGEEIDDDATTMEKIQQALSNKRVKPNAWNDIEGWMWRGFQNTLGPGGLGVPQQVFERLSRGKLGSETLGPAFSEMDRGFKALNALKEGEYAEAAGEAASYIPGVGSELRSGINPPGNVNQNPAPRWGTRAYDALTGETTVGQALKGGILGGDENLSEGRRASKAALKAKQFEARSRDVGREVRAERARRAGRPVTRERGVNLREELANQRKARARWRAQRKQLEALRR